MDRFLDAMRMHASALDMSTAQTRLATIQSFDPATHSVKVTLQPEGIQTGWIPMGAVAVGNGIGLVIPPAKGDQVIVHPQEGDADTWHASQRFWHDDAKPPMSPITNKPIQSGEIGLFFNGGCLHVIDGVVHFRASSFKIVGDVEIEGDLTVKGKISATQDIIAGTLSVAISLLQHLHNGITRGGSRSNKPVPP